MEDKEIQAIATVNTALSELNEDERYRVIQWVANKYVAQGMQPMKVANPTLVTGATTVDAVVETDADESDPGSDRIFETFAELLEATGAEAEAELLIAAGYWLQVHESKAQWTSREANSVLRPTGMGIDRMDNLMPRVLGEKPKRVIQIAKNKSASGHGHRQLKLTDIGLKWVKGKING